MYVWGMDLDWNNGIAQEHIRMDDFKAEKKAYKAENHPWGEMIKTFAVDAFHKIIA